MPFAAAFALLTELQRVCPGLFDLLLPFAAAFTRLTEVPWTYRGLLGFQSHLLRPLPFN